MLLDIFKDGELVETMELSASKRVYKVGRQAGLADIVLAHGSISRAGDADGIGLRLGCCRRPWIGAGTLISGKKLAPISHDSATTRPQLNLWPVDTSLQAARGRDWIRRGQRQRCRRHRDAERGDAA